MEDYKVHSIVRYALERANEDLDRLVYRGELTTEQVTEALRLYPDFSDGWAEWLAESE